MIIKDEIREVNVAQGDLVFIFHKEKPYKTGWWRKVREGSSKNNLIYYVLEKPMHKDFDTTTDLQAHKELNLYVMRDSTIKWYEKHKSNKYEIMADIRGVHNVFLSTRGCRLVDILYYASYEVDEDKDDVIITKRFKKLLDLCIPTKESDIQRLAKQLIK